MRTTIEEGFTVAVLIPAHNVAGTIGDVLRGFAEALPAARLYVFDNNSSDDTARIAAHSGARVFREARQGRGNVVRRMFADIEADIYVMAAGDGSYDPADAPSLVNALITEHVDMVIGTRCEPAEGGRAGASDRPFNALYRGIFGAGLTDVSSGYRAFSRRYVKSFPGLSRGFAIETEMSIHASELMIPVAEIELNGGSARPLAAHGIAPAGGLAALGIFAALVRETRPLLFYAGLATLLGAVAIAMALVGSAAQAGAATAAVLAAGAAAMAALAVVCGVLLDSLNRTRMEQKRVLFLAVPALGAQ